MKISKSQIHARVQNIPELRFEEEQRLTSFSGFIIIQILFMRLKLPERLQECPEHRTDRLIVGVQSIVRILIVHLMLGYRRLRDIEFYKDDPMVLQALNVRFVVDKPRSTTIKSADVVTLIPCDLRQSSSATSRVPHVRAMV